ncbi:voltage-gated hydrogen channel 1-like protein [Corchorus capsularis]|uniref:Voltage-gated hydrogen channel 1-like protein n=1 Tax=Corchorus capsularis TaxID=210143 RepID=A0A1R3HLC5_COCAP|nr:voltage-gated hydrogen channel 1-like protein [Corchorus capsularis]
MNNPTDHSTRNGPSHHQQQSISIESVEISIQNLIKCWSKRQRWQHFFDPKSGQDQSLSSRAPWRIHLAKFLESTKIRIVAILLLLLDLILTILELSSTLLSCSPNKSRTTSDHIERAWYHWVGISILAVLSAKSVALAMGLGGAFFRRPGYVVDGVVVVGALLLEAFLERKGGGLLVVVCLWRVVRVVESAFELSDEAIEAQIEGIVGQFEAIREENTRLLAAIADKDQIIETLQAELDHCRLS